MKRKTFVSLIAATSICMSTLPFAHAVQDGRMNLPQEFTAGKVETASTFSYGTNAGVAVLKDDHSLWLSGWCDNKFFEGFTKVADDVKSYMIGTGILSIIKTDDTLWKVELSKWKDEDSFKKIFDNVIDANVWTQNTLVINDKHELWGWGYDLNCSYFPIDVNTLPSSVLDKSDPWYTIIKNPVKMMDDVVDYEYTFCAGLFLKTDGTVYGIGSNSHGHLGSSISDDTYNVTTPVEIIDNVKKLIPSDRACMVIRNDDSLWAWGNMPWQGEYEHISRPIKLADDVVSATEMNQSIAIVKKDGSLWTYGGITPGETDSVSNTLKKADIQNVAGVFGGIYNHDCLALKKDGSLWAWGITSRAPDEIAGTDAKDIYNYMPSGGRLTDYLQIAGPDSSPAVDAPAQKPSATATAKPTSAKVLVNGKRVSFDAYEINNNNYFKLRDIAKVLSGSEKQFEVSWDGTAKSIAITPNKAYTSVGGELSAGKAKQQTAKLSTDTVYINGSAASLTAYNIADNNYFKLRDLGKRLDFGVDWDGNTQSISIDTGIGYSAE